MPIKLNAVLDEIPIGICLMSKEGRIVLMNRALEALTGFSRMECKGLRCSHVLQFKDWFENSSVKKMESCEKCVLEGDIVSQENQKVPVRVTFAPLRDKTGEISGYILKIEYPASSSRAERVELGELPAYLTEHLAGLDRAEDGGQSTDDGYSPSSDIRIRTEVGGQNTEDEYSLSSVFRPPSSVPSPQIFDWSSVERKMILDALAKVSGRRSKAAQLLGWGRSTLWRKMKQYGIGGESVQDQKSKARDF